MTGVSEKAPPSQIDEKAMAWDDVAVEHLDQSAEFPDPDEGKSDEERATLDRKVLWKVDLWLVPWLSFLYLVSFIDRTNIGNARLVGMEDDLNMSGTDYNMTLSVFFIGYAIFEPFSNALLKLMTPRVFFTLIILVWGTIMTLMGVVTNYPGLLAARFFLGFAEAGLFPGVNYYLSCYYKRDEIGLRTAIFFSSAALAGSFGGLLAAAIAKLDGLGGRPGWAWIFILEGIGAVLTGVASWWLVFDWPETARFLSPDERLRLCRRLLADKQRQPDGFDKGEMKNALKDWKTYLYCIINMGSVAPVYAFSLFLPTILVAMGYTGTQGQLMSVPPYAAGAVCTVLVGVIADRTRQRGLCSMACSLVSITGFIMLISSANPRVQYAGTFLGAMGIYPSIPNGFAWVANNTEGSLKKGITIGMMAGWANLNGVASSNIYIQSQRPRYPTGHGTVLGYLIVGQLFGSALMYVLLKLENRKRLSGRRNNEVAAKSEHEIYMMGDKRPTFIYTL